MLNTRGWSFFGLVGFIFKAEKCSDKETFAKRQRTKKERKCCHCSELITTYITPSTPPVPTVSVCVFSITISAPAESEPEDPLELIEEHRGPDVTLRGDENLHSPRRPTHYTKPHSPTYPVTYDPTPR